MSLLNKPDAINYHGDDLKAWSCLPGIFFCNVECLVSSENVTILLRIYAYIDNQQLLETPIKNK